MFGTLSKSFATSVRDRASNEIVIAPKTAAISPLGANIPTAAVKPKPSVTKVPVVKEVRAFSGIKENARARLILTAEVVFPSARATRDCGPSIKRRMLQAKP
ncbi:hypothetical protein IMSAGC007_03414 [Lachnospiraceae bacterium]|nr:hypothetical protein IMSAGC007_03414 [Lachnospiraceae bacterium]